ncbi:MAG: NAD(P)-dependent oxidoreductase [Phycisphaerales bacterium]
MPDAAPLPIPSEESSTPPKPLVIQTEELSDEAAAWLAARVDLQVCGVDEARFGQLLSKAAGLVVRTYTRVDAGLLGRAPNLKVVGRAGVAVDNIDVAACREQGVEVVHTPDANTRAVVELVTAFLLDAIRPRLFLDKALGKADWKRVRGELVGERQACQMTLGVLGFGRIGSKIARVGQALGMRVVYCDLREIPEPERGYEADGTGEHGRAQPVSFEKLFELSDVVTVHVDNRPENRRIVDLDALKMLPPGAILINTSRGFVVDALSVAAWLRDDPAAQAILDVHDPEPIEEDAPLLGLANAHLSPHIGAATRLAHANMSWVVRDVWRVLQGERPYFPAP